MMTTLKILDVAVKKDERRNMVSAMGEDWVARYERVRQKNKAAMLGELTLLQRVVIKEPTKYGIASNEILQLHRNQGPQKLPPPVAALKLVLANAVVTTQAELRDVCEATRKIDPAAVALWAAGQLQQLNDQKVKSAGDGR